MEQIFRRNKLTVWYYIWNKYLYKSVLVFLYRALNQRHSYDVHPFLIRQKHLKKFWMIVAPFCQGNDQTPRLYFKVWLVVLSPWWCGLGERTAPPSMSTCLACFPLEISTCVGKRIGVHNPKNYRQNQMPLSHLSEVICTNAKQWLLCLTHCACRNLMEIGILPQL